MKKKTQNQFIKEANLKHNNFYDYSKSIYKNANEKITIICPKHGKFQQRAIDHLKGFGCKFCAYENNGNIFRFTQKEFIQKANQICGKTAPYTKLLYFDNNLRLINLPRHESFAASSRALFDLAAAIKRIDLQDDNRAIRDLMAYETK